MYTFNPVPFILLFFLLHGYAQSQETGTLRISSDTLKVNSLYKYPHFQKGKLTFKDGSAGFSTFNINMLINEIQFINPKGDTLSLADDDINRIDNVLIGDRQFYFKQGVIEIVRNFAPVKLGANEKFDVTPVSKRRSFGEAFGVSRVQNGGAFYINNQLIVIHRDENDLLARKTVNYYFVNSNMDIVLPATKKNLFKVCREHHQKALSAFLTDNNIDFKKEDDLCKLLSFFEQLAKNK